MGELHWLDSRVDSDVSEWLLAWESMPERRPHYHPAYVRAFAPTNRYAAAVHFLGPSGSHVLYPFTVGSIGNLPFCPAGCVDACDLVSPYGYGGPSYFGPAEVRTDCVAEFRNEFARACAARAVVSEFVRQDILCDHLVDDVGEQVYLQDNVVVRLGFTEAEHLALYRHKVRKNVRRARNEGLIVEFEADDAHLPEFCSVYAATMARNGAAQYYRFDAQVFRQIVDVLGPSGSLVFAHVFDDGRLVSTELLLLSNHTMYSFLGGTLEEALPKRPNDLLKHETIVWGGRNGYEHYILGGGATPGDGIFCYKESFAPGGLLPFVVRQRVHNASAYAELIAARDADPTAGRRPPMFFPAYRA